MARYYLIARQESGYGCDYTIGCGISINEIDGVKTMQEAVDSVVKIDMDQIEKDLDINDDDFEGELSDYINDYYNLLRNYKNNEGSNIVNVEILEVTSSIDLNDHIVAAQKKLKSIKKQIKTTLKEKQERATYEALKQKYGETK